MSEDVLPVGLESLHEYFINPSSLDKNSGEYHSRAQPRQVHEELTGAGAQRKVEEHQGAHLTQRCSTEYDENVVAS